MNLPPEFQRRPEQQTPSACKFARRAWGGEHLTIQLHFLFVLFSALGLVCATAEPAARRLDIIFLLADDLGYGDVGCFGQKQIHTPNLDRLAAEGMRFTAHYARNNVCAPSRCVLMTGLHPGYAFIRDNKQARAIGLPPSIRAKFPPPKTRCSCRSR